MLILPEFNHLISPAWRAFELWFKIFLNQSDKPYHLYRDDWARGFKYHL